MVSSDCSIIFPCNGVFVIQIFMLFWFVHLDRATYNCPCEKTGSLRLTPTYSKVCPCDLLIVIAKAGIIGNCRLFKVNGKFTSLGSKSILGRVVMLPLWLSEIISATKEFVLRAFMINRVPLHNPFLGFKFLKSITTVPTFNFKLCGGNPERDTWRWMS